MANRDFLFSFVSKIMLNIQHIRQHRDQVVAALSKRGLDAAPMINEAIALDDKRKKLQFELDERLAEAKKLAAQIGQLMKSGEREKAEAIKTTTAELKSQNQETERDLKEVMGLLDELMATIPNAPHHSVPAGRSSEENEEVRAWGTCTKAAHAEPHWDLAKKFGLIDFEVGVKITGAGFPVYRGKGAKLQRALIQFFLDEAEQAGYEEVIPPHLVNADSGFGTGQLPDKDGQMYHAREDDLYLIPTAEVPITNIYRDEILSESELPIQVCGYSPCFRREAGSYGKDVRGLNRLHQFDKVEIVQITNEACSYEAIDGMVAHVENLLKKLELPYRVLRLCGGDMGFTAALTYDLEVYSSAQDRWLEVSSVSNFESYQSTRMKLRIKGADGKKTLAHTLNGSALALPRIVAALLENHFDGEKINIPAALHSYTKFESIS